MALGVVVVLVVGAVAWFVLHSALFGARVVTVAGAHAATPTAAILAAADLSSGTALISLDPGVVAARVARLPYVGSVQVVRRWPDGVRITVTQRTPCGQLQGPGSAWTVVDCTGRALVVQPTRQAGIPLLAVTLRGAPLTPPAVGATLPAAAHPVVAVTAALPPAYSALVGSVTQSADGTVRVGLTDGLTIVMGTATQLRAKEEAAAAILAGGTLHAGAVIDVSAPGSPVVGTR